VEDAVVERRDNKPVYLSVMLYAREETVMVQQYTGISNLCVYSGGNAALAWGHASIFAVNNRVVIPLRDNNIGLNVVVVDPTCGEVVVAHSFNTYDASYENDPNYGGMNHPSNELINCINNLIDGQWFSCAVRCSAGAWVSEDLKKALEALGSKRIRDVASGDSWAFLVQKGSSNLANIQETYASSASTLGATVSWPPLPHAGQAISSLWAYSEGWYAGSRTWIMVNDKRVLAGIGGLGLNVVVVNPQTGQAVNPETNQPDQGKTFDTWSDPQASGAFDSFIDHTPDGYWVILASCNDASYRLSQSAKNTIKALGSKHITNMYFRDSWAFIGQKGGDPSKVQESYPSMYAAAVAHRFL
jgi:hypothetical protein